MNNFFFDASDYPLFKKALKTVDKEPVVINILSTDSSLRSSADVVSESEAVHKNLSKKYEPSPFGKFFGPRKQQASSVDMKDFSSWKNKNYRKTEESIKNISDASLNMSLSDFMNDKSSSKYTELDQAKSDMQKPINELSTSDPLYKRFSLDSYMHKLEEQTKTRDSFEQNDDILEPLGDKLQTVVSDSSQDENFGFGSNVNIEKVAFDENISGDEFKFDQEELDKFKARIEKIEREAANIKEKSKEKVISSNELSELGGFNLDNLTNDEKSEPKNPELIDDIEKINGSINSTDNLTLDIGENNDVAQEQKPSLKRFFEVNKNENVPQRKAAEVIDTSQDTESVDIQGDLSFDENLQGDSMQSGEIDEETNADENVDITSEEDEILIGEESNTDDFESTVSTKSRIDREDIVTKDDLKSMTDELVDKFTELYGKDKFIDKNQGTMQPTDTQFVGGYEDPSYGYVDPNYQTYGGVNDLKSQLQELIETNKKLDYENEKRLREAELEKERVAAEYESRIKEMEMSFKQNYEDFKKQAYLDKLDRDIKLKEAETKFKKKTNQIKEQEKETYSKERTGAMLRKELKSHLNISNLEMDKKLLEIASGLSRVETEKLLAENNEMERKLQEEIDARLASQAEPEVVEEDEVEEVEEVEPEKTVKKTTRKRRTSTSRSSGTRRKTRRKIDSDIIGGIDFE